MGIPILAVDNSTTLWMREQAEWEKRGIGVLRTGTMREAIDKLCHDIFLLVSINADNITYMPLLPTMRELVIIPIFVITAHFTVAEQVKALRAGADAYTAIQGGAEDNVNLAIAFLHRYNEQREQFDRPVMWRDLVIDSTLHKAFMKEHEMKLTPLEFAVLRYLAINHGRPMSKERIYTHAWREDNCEDVDGVVAYQIHNIRQELARYTNEEYIKTVWGIGFKLE